MTKTETIEKVIRGSIKQLNAGRALDQQVSADRSTLLATLPGPLESLSIVDLMEPRSPVPVPPEWQPCISLKDGRVAIEAESQEDGDGNR
jgi:hypothetical protein